jgi:hypothetical protein
MKQDNRKARAVDTSPIRFRALDHLPGVVPMDAASSSAFKCALTIDGETPRRQAAAWTEISTVDLSAHLCRVSASTSGSSIAGLRSAPKVCSAICSLRHHL